MKKLILAGIMFGCSIATAHEQPVCETYDYCMGDYINCLMVSKGSGIYTYCENSYDKCVDMQKYIEEQKKLKQEK